MSSLSRGENPDLSPEARSFYQRSAWYAISQLKNLARPRWPDDRIAPPYFILNLVSAKQAAASQVVELHNDLEDSLWRKLDSVVDGTCDKDVEGYRQVSPSYSRALSPTAVASSAESIALAHTHVESLGGELSWKSEQGLFGSSIIANMISAFPVWRANSTEAQSAKPTSSEQMRTRKERRL